MSQGTVSPGQVLAGKYRVERVLGQGGMGVVVAATHLHLDERVALKFLLPHVASGDVVTRFLREAKAAVRIKNEHVARVSDVGSLEDGAPYMVMEFLDGEDLAQLLASRGPIAEAEVVDFILQAGEALAEAHSYGIVHRDLKPANLFLTRRVGGHPLVKVLDFGISKQVSGPDSALTKTGGMLGSPLYMSPEQLRSARAVDARSDIWSLGVIMYELLTGVPPFMGEDLPQVCIAIIQGEIAPMAQHYHGVSAGLEAVVRRCLTREPEHRYQSILELAEALSPFASARATRSVEIIRDLAGGQAQSTSPSRPSGLSHPPAAPAQTLAPIGATHAPIPAPPSPARATGWIAGIALLVVASAGAAWRFARGTGAPPASSTAYEPAKSSQSGKAEAVAAASAAPSAGASASAAASASATGTPVETHAASSASSASNAGILNKPPPAVKTPAPPLLPAKPTKAKPTPGAADDRL